ncbi:MAG TPA: aldehyde dehydrogenase [Draconibacterium sp.]|nr:aldehyde dehydrogenase [Draconibacterium sp.]
MEQYNITEIIEKQTAFFNSSATIPVDFRIQQLKRLKQTIKKYENETIKALNKDLGKSEFEAFTGEVGLAVHEISFHIKHLKSWAKPKKVSTPIFSFPSKSYIHKQPYGNILIIGPFNFPFMLTIIPLIGAISAGNVAVIKPSEYTTATSLMIEKIIAETFQPEYVTVVQGGVDISQKLMDIRWDKIFFTGSSNVGKIVMQAAAKNLTPVVLELGGKNPVVVDKDANLEVAAKRIIWGKFFNAGQSCVAPDHLFVHEDVQEKLLPYLKQAVVQFYSENPKESKDFARIINEKTTRRLSEIIKNEKIYLGGTFEHDERYFAPTILTEIKEESPVMQDEIFGPVLPIITFKDLNNVVNYINQKEKPLVLYYFSEDRKKQKEILNRTFSGDACINEVVVHFTNFSLPFGGVGYSGMGTYHGKHSFEIFSHSRSVMKTTTAFDLPFRYAPDNKLALKLMRFLFR